MHISGNIEAMFFKVKNDTCDVVAMTSVLPLVLSELELEFPVLVLTMSHSNNLIRTV